MVRFARRALRVPAAAAANLARTGVRMDLGRPAERL